MVLPNMESIAIPIMNSGISGDVPYKLPKLSSNPKEWPPDVYWYINVYYIVCLAIESLYYEENNILFWNYEYLQYNIVYVIFPISLLFDFVW